MAITLLNSTDVDALLNERKLPDLGRLFMLWGGARVDDPFKTLSRDSRAELADILQLWTGISIRIPQNAGNKQIVDLAINRGVYTPSYLARVNLKDLMYAQLDKDTLPDYPEIISWLGNQLENRGYQRVYRIRSNPSKK